MQVKWFRLTLTTESPDKLFAFYKDVIGLPVTEGMEMTVNAAGTILVFRVSSSTSWSTTSSRNSGASKATA